MPTATVLSTFVLTVVQLGTALKFPKMIGMTTGMANPFLGDRFHIDLPNIPQYNFSKSEKQSTKEMKPTKNRHYCAGCQHHKMLFKTKEEAVRFINYNADTVEQETGRRPVRAYYCHICGGWHVTSSRYSQNRKSIIRRFGEEKGAEISAKVTEICEKCRNVEEGLLRKIRELRHLLKFNQIDADRCYDKIQKLMEDFEVVIACQFGEQTSIEKLFDRFMGLCSVYHQKTQTNLQIA